MALYFTATGNAANVASLVFTRDYVTDDSIFSGKTKEQVLSQYGVYEIEGSVEPPPGKIVVDYGAAWTVGEPWPHLTGIYQDIDLTALKAQMKLDLAAARWTAAAAGFSYLGSQFDSDNSSLVNYVAILMAASQDPNYTVNFKTSDGNFLNLNAMQAAGLAMACRAHVQACFDRESEIKTSIDNATTFADLQAIDFTTGWPT